jgi:hypothetical protein
MLFMVVVVVEAVKTGIPHLELAVTGVALVEKHEVQGHYYCQHFWAPC